jgi:hypothetical protein
MARVMGLALVLAACLASTGCYGQVLRTLTIESEPPGAVCWLNDNEIGRTPITVPFTYYGTYGVRLEYPGYEPLTTKAKVRMPFYENIPLDLAFETVVPGIQYDTHEFKFALKKAEPVDPDALRQRAEGFRKDAQTP